MDNPFQTIGIIGKYGFPDLQETVDDLCQFLTGRGCEVLLDESTAEHLKEAPVGTVNRAELGERCDLAIVVGGDGTLLNAARSLSDYGVPLLGINLGRLGFLVDVSPDKHHAMLSDVLDGKFKEEQRFMLHSSINRAGEFINQSDAMNDVVIHKWDVSRMIEFEVYVDGRFLYTLRSDGLIVATPTGSTAYALSGGGPIIDPALNALVLVPICPHTLTNRPIVVDANSRIEIVVFESNNANAQVTCDGQIEMSLVSGDRIYVERKEKPVRLIHPLEYDYFQILRSKLSWGTKL
jgi:NAD+ kinase